VTKAVFRKRDARTLAAVDQEGLDLLARIKGNRDVVVEVKQARNPRHHRLLWAMLKLIADHTDRFPSTAAALTALKVACGEVDPVIDPVSGEVFWTTRSIAFESMSQVEFAAFFDRAVNIVANRWMPPHTTPESVRAEIEAMIEPGWMKGRAA
jgi:hypothetical protein